MKILINMLVALAVVTALAQECNPYRVEVQSEFVTFDTTALERWRKENPTQMMDFAALSGLRGKSKATVLFSPSLLMLSGRESSVKAVEEMIYPTEMSLDSSTNSEGRTTNVLRPSKFEMREVGHIFQVLPEVIEAEALDIHVNISAEIISPPVWRAYAAKVIDHAGAKKDVEFQQPFFYTRKVETCAILKNGRPALVGGGMNDRDGKTVTFVLVTARVIDSEGNPVLTKPVDANPPEPCNVLAESLRTVIFPEARAWELMRRVCYRVPPGISSFWTPAAVDLEGVEKGLMDYLDGVKPEAKSTWTKLHKQVTGVRRGEDRYLFISYFLFEPAPEEGVDKQNVKVERWKMFPYWVCDGGAYYFRVLYDVKRKKFVWFECNGVG